jgi:hypothetical protein
MTQHSPQKHTKYGLDEMWMKSEFHENFWLAFAASRHELATGQAAWRDCSSEILSG